MDAVTIGAVLLAVVSGAGGQLGTQLWEGVVSLVRHPFRRQATASLDASAAEVAPAGKAELAALQQAPGDRRKALALAEALLTRSRADGEFLGALESWWQQAEPVRARIGNVTNTISRGTHQGLVLQGRDFSKITFAGTTAAAAPVALAQLPALVPGFTGRRAELAQITALLDPAEDTGAVVVSAVAGLAGVGKTALAVHASHATRQAGWFPGGVLFLNLHGYDDASAEPGQALDALLRALGVAAEHIPPGTEERAGLYRSVLAQISDPVLIIADNASSEAQVRLLLPGPGPHRMLITSRNTLAGLGARLLDVVVLDDEAGVTLLDQALRAARPGDDRIGAHYQEAMRLARMCGGLPLALQITAALLKADLSRTVSDLADELADEIRRLEALQYDDGGGTSALSVAAAFELSYRQLDELAALLFRLLPVNPVPDLSTAAAAALADLPVGDVRKVIGRLVRAHLAEAAAGTAGRWRMHDLVRLYARQLSDEHAGADGREQARDRLFRYYLCTAKAARDHLWAPPGAPVPADFTGRDDALAWLDAERPGLVAAVRIAADVGLSQVALNLPLVLAGYLSWRRRWDDKISTATVSLYAARDLHDRHHEGIALMNRGSALREVRRFTEAIAAHQDAVAIFRETGDRNNEGRALDHLGLALRKMGRFAEAIAAHQGAVPIFRETGDRNNEGRALDCLGLALRKMSRFAEAIAAHQGAVAIFRETGDRADEGGALNNLGLALREAGRIAEAIASYQEAVSIDHETSKRNYEGIALDNLGVALREAGRLDEAVSAHQTSVDIHRETGDQHHEGKTQDNFGVALREAGRLDEAVSAHQTAVAIFRDIGDPYREGKALDNLGVALREAGRLDDAVSAHQTAVAIFRDIGDQHHEGKALDNLKTAQAAK